MIVAHRTTMVIALTVATGLAGCAEAPTIVPDAQSSLVRIVRPDSPEHQQSVQAPSHLVSCSWMPSASVTATIGEEGGTISVAGHHIRIPPGAVQEPTVFTASVPAGPRLALRLEAPTLGTSGLARNAQATISYAHCGRQDLQHRAVRVLAISAQPGAHVTSDEVSEVGSSHDWLREVLDFVLVQMGTYAVAY